MVVLSWCHSQRLLELFSVSSYGRGIGEELLHVVWRFWVTVLKGVIFFLRLAMRRYGDFWVGLSDELLLRRYFRGLYVILSVVSGGQYGGDLSLYVVWILWDTVWRRMTWLFLVLAARFYRDSRDWYCYVVRGNGRLVWLGVGPIWLMDVMVVDGPVTEVVLREESGELMSTTGQSRFM
ncbi:hypothetical protein RchiOBHm_Chr2g0116941 [Rosa chinensis]|uniref:Transmembrane protein n=1 Tax=Rosa chinensis TaxID=74649 RepID=A0A2P6RRD4_ROSCH|nr:hypothetical protein RchiOBHm_Chr2g0116941 [Rosa chinensis]